MRKGFGRQRRGGRGGGRETSLVEVEALLGRLVTEGIVPVTSLEPVPQAVETAELAALGRGATETGVPVLAVVAMRSAGDALFVALSEAAKQEGFAGEVYVVAPSWPSRARRRFGLVGRLPFRLHAVVAPLLTEGAEEVEPEPLVSPAVVSARQIGAQLGLVGERALFERAAQALGGLATKHGGVLRGAESALEVILQGRRVAALRADDGGVVLDAILPRQSSERLSEAGLPGVLDRLEGQLRKFLNDKRVRNGEEGFRVATLSKLIQTGQYRDLVAWPLGGSDIPVLDFAGVAQDGRPIVGAARKRIDLQSLGVILDAVITLRPFLATLLEGAPPPVRLDAPRVLLAATEFTSDVLALVGCLNLNVARVRVRAGGGKEVELLAEGDTQAAPSPVISPVQTASRPRWREEAQGPRSDTQRSERLRDREEKEGVFEERKGFQEISGFDLQEERRPERERGRGRGRGRGRRGPRRGEESTEETSEEGTRESAFQEVSAFDLQVQEDLPERGRRRGRGRGGRREEGEGRAAGEPSERGGEGRVAAGPTREARGKREDQDLRRRETSPEALIDDDEFVEALSPFDPELLEAVEEGVVPFDVDEAEESEGTGARKQREREARKLERESKQQGAPLQAVEPVKPRPRRAAILAHNDRDSLLAGILLAREIRLLDGFWVYSQEELMTFFRSVVTDLHEKTPLYVVGFKASPARELIQTAALYRDRLVWFDCHEWPPEDLQSMKSAIGEDAVHVVPGAETVLPAVVAVCDRRSRFSDKLVDLATGRFSEHDFQHWGRLWLWRLDEIASKVGERRAEIEPLLVGRPSDLSKESSSLPLPSVPAEVDYVAGRDFRTAYFGGYGLVAGEIAKGLNLHLGARILRSRYQAPLSLTWSAGTDLLILAAEDAGSTRPLDCVGMVEHLAEKLPWVHPLDDDDRVARFRVDDFQTKSERLDEVLSEIAMGRSVLEG